MKKHGLVLISFLIGPFLHGQNGLNLLRLALYGKENPSAIHLNGNTGVKAAFGKDFSDMTHQNSGFWISHYIPKYNFALQLRLLSETDEVSNKSSRTMTLNMVYPIQQKSFISLGGELQFATVTYFMNSLSWADQSNGVDWFTKPTMEGMKGHAEMQPSLSLSVMYYDTLHKYYLGVTCRNINRPDVDIGASSYGIELPFILNSFMGYSNTIAKNWNASSTLFYQYRNPFHEFSFKQDIMYKNKYWLSDELLFNKGFKLSFGYQPGKKLNIGVTINTKWNILGPNSDMAFHTINILYAF
jgi:hypothetical protein